MWDYLIYKKFESHKVSFKVLKEKLQRDKQHTCSWNRTKTKHYTPAGHVTKRTLVLQERPSDSWKQTLERSELILVSSLVHYGNKIILFKVEERPASLKIYHTTRIILNM